MLIRDLRSLLCALAFAPSVLPLQGCAFTREETITVRPDGGVNLHSEFSGNRELMAGRTADAIPDPTAPDIWRVTESAEGASFRRIAELDAPPGALLPSSYAPAGDPRVDSGVRFPTTLKIETHDGRTVFDFKRVYLRRDDAAYVHFQKQLESTETSKALRAVAPKDLTDEDRLILARDYGRIEASKFIAMAEAAAVYVQDDPRWTQELDLRLRRVILDFAEHFDYRPAAKLLGASQSPDDKNSAAILAAARSFKDGIAGAIAEKVRSFNILPQTANRFLDNLNAERRRRQTTEDLMLDVWEVRVIMPGKLIEHNADRTELIGNDLALVWRFSSSAIMDRDQRIMASSWIPAVSK